MKTFYAIPHSPWSERARFALLHHGIDFHERTHVPLIGEIPLRVRARKWRGKVTVPLLVDDAVAVQGSLAIAEHVDGASTKSTLFPAGKRDEIASLYDELEEGMRAARERFTIELPKSPEAQRESVPGFLRGLGLARPASSLGSWFIATKYDAREGSVDTRMRRGLSRVREVIGRKAYVYDTFSFADIVAASVIQTIRPFDEKFLVIPPATRNIWHHRVLAEEFADLVAWRDGVYEKYRPITKSR